MPEMPDDQLKLNIPFEFMDYISGDVKDYIFDYAKRNIGEKDSSGNANLIAYAVPVEYVRSIGNTLRLAGLKLERAVPETLVYETVLADMDDTEDARKERCFLDIGSGRITMRMFKDGGYKLSHIIDIGENKIIQAIADDLNIDVNLAETYLRSNYQNCQDCRGAVNAYKDISLEIIKGLNYYDMSDMTSKLKDIVLCGPGAMTEPLVALLKERIDRAVYTIQEMISGESEDAGLNVTFASAVALNSYSRNIGIEESAAYADVKKSDWRLVLLGIAAAVIAGVLVAKFGVIDRYAALSRAQAHEADLQMQVDAANQFLANTDELSVEYYHYTWDDMTEEEKGRVSRVDVAKLADFIVSQGVSVKSMNLAGTTLVVGVTGDSLNTMSRLTAALTDQDIVESCSLSMAQKETVEGTQNSTQVSASSDEESETDGEYFDTASSNNIVNAEINIYLTTLDSGSKGGE